MKKWVSFFFLFVSLGFSSSAVLANLPDFTSLVENNAPSVVKITTVTKRGGKVYQQQVPEVFKQFFGERFRFATPERSSESLGSGFIVSKDGYVLTNHHVVAGADVVKIRLADQREFDAQVVGTDPLSDVAVLKIEGENFKPVQLGNSQKLKVGEWVLAIGSPFGLDYSATAGIVSAKRRPLQNQNYVPFIQTDVAINPGNSGGPLFNLDGEVVGINSQIFTRTGGYMGMSFAIPISVAMDVYAQLKDTGHVARGWLGVVIQDVDHNLARSFGLDRPRGALIAQVMPGSPGEKSGLRASDVVLNFDGNPIHVSAELPHFVGRAKIGVPVPVEIMRGGKRKTIKVTVGALPNDELAEKAGNPNAQASLGAHFSDLSAEQKIALKLDYGVVVQGVEKGMLLDAKLQRGDIITMLDNHKIESVKQLLSIFSKLPPQRWVAMQVHRGGVAQFLSVYTGE